MTCTVSIPDNSSKNHPQLVYINIKWRCISRSFRVVILSLSCRFSFAFCRKNRSTFSGERSSITRMYSLRASQGSFRKAAARSAYFGARSSRSQSNAFRNNPRQDWFQSECPPELHPQSDLQRSIPCTQLQELFSKIST